MSFIYSPLDVGDVIYKYAYNRLVHAKIKSHQYSAPLAITGANKGSSEEELSQEIGLEVHVNRNANNLIKNTFKHDFFRNCFFTSVIRIYIE